MSDIKWNAGSSGDFGSATAWTGGAKPGAKDNAIINAAGSAYTVTSTTNETVLSIQTAAFATLDVTGGGFDATAGSGAGANAGAIVVSGTGRFRSAGTLTNSGTIEATTGGKVGLTGVVNNAGGTIDAAGGHVLLKDVVIDGGTLTGAAGHGIRVNKSGGGLDGSSGHAITLTTTLVIGDGISESATGSVINKGRIGMAHRGGGTTELAVGTTGLTLSGGGVVVLTGASVAKIDTATTGTLTNVDNRIVGGGTIGGAGLTLVNDKAGFIANGFGGALTINTGANVVSNAGHIEGRAGGLTITGAVNNTGFLIAVGGDLTIDGAVTGSGTASIFGGTLTFGGAFNENVRFNETSKFGRTGGELVLADSQTYTGTISGFSTTNSTKLDLRDIAFSSKTTAKFSGGVLTVTDGTHTAKINLAGSFTGSTWTVSGDGHGGTVVVDPPAAAAALASHMSTFAPASGTGTAAGTSPISDLSMFALAGAH